MIGLYKLTGFFVPGVHSRPLSDDDPDIAPDLMPLREQLMAMVRRPVNIQATRDFVMYVRGELLGQPYLALIDKTPRPKRRELQAPARYNIRHGGSGREDAHRRRRLAPASPTSSSSRKPRGPAVVDRAGAAVRHGAVRRAAADSRSAS